jgi:mono/diheme cytochrome c family protein
MKAMFKPNNNMRNHASVKAALILLVLALFTGCEKSNNSNYNPPADHTISKDGFMHKSGLDQPLTNCVSCHGADLKGGSVGVSCFECHGTKW